MVALLNNGVAMIGMPIAGKAAICFVNPGFGKDRSHEGVTIPDVAEERKPNTTPQRCKQQDPETSTAERECTETGTGREP